MDKIKWNSKPPSPPPPNQGWSRAKGKNAPFSHPWFGGERGSRFSIYFVQDCRLCIPQASQGHVMSVLCKFRVGVALQATRWDAVWAQVTQAHCLCHVWARVNIEKIWAKFRSGNLLENENKNRWNLRRGELLLSLMWARSFEKNSLLHLSYIV